MNTQTYTRTSSHTHPQVRNKRNSTNTLILTNIITYKESQTHIEGVGLSVWVSLCAYVCVCVCVCVCVLVGPLVVAVVNTEIHSVQLSSKCPCIWNKCSNHIRCCTAKDILMDLGESSGYCPEVCNHYRSDPVQVQSTIINCAHHTTVKHCY